MPNQDGSPPTLRPTGPSPEAITRVADYLRHLRLTDEVLIQSLAEDCLRRAQRLMGRESEAELVRRGLEEAQRRFDHALAAAVGMPPSNDPHPLAAIRAALLLNDQLSSDALFRHDHTTLELKDALREALPRSTPEEARLEMKPVPFDFWLFTSTER